MEGEKYRETRCVKARWREEERDTEREREKEKKKRSDRTYIVPNLKI